MKALVVGGGIAGPTAALALAKAGIESDVLERRPVVDPEAGSWFTVAPNGLDVLQAMDAHKAVRDEGVPGHAPTSCTARPGDGSAGSASGVRSTTAWWH